MTIQTNYITELYPPYKVAVTWYEKIVADIAAYSCDTSYHFRSSKVTAI